MLPARIKPRSKRADEGRRSERHRKWVRGFACCACGSQAGIECAHVRTGTDGGMGMKPSDRWCISLCRDCHRKQHEIGESTFADMHQIDMLSLARDFFKASPYRRDLETANG